MEVNTNPQVDYRSNFLEKIYNRFVNNEYSKNTILEEEKWETYNLIIYLLNFNEYKNLIEEIQYRVTGGELPENVFDDILNREIDLPVEILGCRAYLTDIENKEWIEIFS